jgi:glycine/D-amino acid oxidase-like deaminating enzyme
MEVDTAIIGGGIAGVATAYFTLAHTDNTVALLEMGKVAHGATGHNGGFLATYFERSFISLVKEFGLELAAQGQRDVESAWELLESMRTTAQLKTPVWTFTGYAAIATEEELLVHLQNLALRTQAGLEVAPLLVAEHAPAVKRIPHAYQGMYRLVTRSELADLIEVKDSAYFAAVPEKKGCMNSAAFCEELVQYLLVTYPARFTLLEHTPVGEIRLHDGSAVVHAGEFAVRSKRVVLCTNGFENVHIVNTVGPDIDKKFHYLVRGIVGYMAGYIEPSERPPIEISFLPKSARKSDDVYAEEPYFYLTRRPFGQADGKSQNLISIGGPEALMDDTNNYKIDHDYPLRAKEDIDSFLRSTYAKAHPEGEEYKFLWHGLMGFTPNGIRLVGPEPLNPVLLYNLGCNGVGLMPSIFGGRKIARFLAGEVLPPSMFDPVDQRVSEARPSILLRGVQDRSSGAAR